MRDLPARRLATTSLCATLVLGMAGPTAVASDHGSSRDVIQVTESHPPTSPVPGADAFLTQVQRVAGADGTVAPVTDLLNAVLAADNGRLSADKAAGLGKAVKDAIAKMGGATSTASATSAPGDVLGALQKSVDKLISVSTAGQSGDVLPAARDVLGSLVRVVLAGLIVGGLPHHPGMPVLPSLPPMPTMPATPSLRPMPVPSPAVTAPSTATTSASRPMG
ncbi:hypothetical protein AB0D09_29330 [Streptomyces sp. NPDC049097]|uniref:hypothetical protein n=1 Tax=unclassified Streptomyces TaxID=2593676 RepID=UPI0033E6D98D